MLIDINGVLKNIENVDTIRFSSTIRKKEYTPCGKMWAYLTFFYIYLDGKEFKIYEELDKWRKQNKI